EFFNRRHIVRTAGLAEAVTVVVRSDLFPADSAIDRELRPRDCTPSVLDTSQAPHGIVPVTGGVLGTRTLRVCPLEVLGLLPVDIHGPRSRIQVSLKGSLQG